MWLIVTLVSLVALFLIVLSIPLDLSLRLDVDGRARFRLKLFWLYGLVGKEFKRRKRKAKPKRAKKKGEGARKAFKILRAKGLPNQIKVLIADVFNSLSIKQLRVNFSIGFDNPADTGLLFAALGPASVFFNPPDRCSINIRPAFENEAILEGHMQAVVRLLPIRLVIPLVKFVFSLPTLSFIKAAVLYKWKKKR